MRDFSGWEDNSAKHGMIAVVYVRFRIVFVVFRFIIQRYDDFFDRRPCAFSFKKGKSPFVLNFKQQAVLRQNEVITASAWDDRAQEAATHTAFPLKHHVDSIYVQGPDTEVSVIKVARVIILRKENREDRIESPIQETCGNPVMLGDAYVVA